MQPRIGNGPNPLAGGPLVSAHTLCTSVTRYDFEVLPLYGCLFIQLLAGTTFYGMS